MAALIIFLNAIIFSILLFTPFTVLAHDKVQPPPAHANVPCQCPTDKVQPPPAPAHANVPSPTDKVQPPPAPANVPCPTDNVPCPADKSQMNVWFNKNIQPSGSRTGTLDAALKAAEASSITIKVKVDGSGDFKTICDAVKSIPDQNKQRVIISLGPGNYSDKVIIPSTKPFVTLYGDPKNMPTIVYGGAAAQYGTADSATMLVESDYFSAVNIIFANSAPKLDVRKGGHKAEALRIGGDKVSFHNCKFYGFQDTLFTNKGSHLFKDCYIEATADFIFGNGKSLYLNVESHVIPGIKMGLMNAQKSIANFKDAGYSFIHCKMTGFGGIGFLSKALMPYSKVVFSYSDLSKAVSSQGWSDNFGLFRPDNIQKVFFGQYSCTGFESSNSNLNNNFGFAKQLSGAEAKPFLSLGFIQASKWVLPPCQI